MVNLGLPMKDGARRFSHSSIPVQLAMCFLGINVKEIMTFIPDLISSDDGSD